MSRYCTQALLLITVLGIIRLFTPLDHRFVYWVESEHLIPTLQSALAFTPTKMVNLTVGQFLSIVWGLGTVLYASKVIIALTRDHKMRTHYPLLRNELVESVARDLDLKYSVVISPCVPTPYVAGIFKPTIYLPPLDLSEKEWHFVLWHELQHLCSHDLPIKLFYFSLAAIFWWNPFSHLFVKELDFLLELRCEANLACRLSDGERVDYLQTVVKVGKQISRPVGNKFAAHSGLFDSTADIKHRFNFVLDYDERKFRVVRTTFCITAIILFSLSYFIIFQPAYTPPAEDLEDVHTVTESSAFILFDGTNYSFYIDNNFIEFIPEDMLDDDPYVYLPIYEGE